MYKRAAGAAKFTVSYLHIIECQENYTGFVVNILRHSGCIVVKHKSVKEFISYVAGRDENEIYVVDAWRSRIGIAKQLKKINKRVIVIEDHPISFERFSSRRIKDRIVTNPLIYKIRISRSLNIFKKVDYLVTNSEVTSEFLSSKWCFDSNFVSYPPIHDDVFRYDGASKRDSIVIHCPSNLNQLDLSNIKMVLKSVDFKNIWLLNPKSGVSDQLEAFKEFIIVKNIYTFEEIRDIYSHSFMSIIPETLGAFELVPIESIASGVPVLGNQVPSIEVINLMLGKYGVSERPFFNIQNLNAQNFRNWVIKIQKYMEEISHIVNERFSPNLIMKEFIDKINTLEGTVNGQ
jgi:glycosyltransferase involved in cell wall biosynthesis